MQKCPSPYPKRLLSPYEPIHSRALRIAKWFAQVGLLQMEIGDACTLSRYGTWSLLRDSRLGITFDCPSSPLKAIDALNRGDHVYRRLKF